MGRAGGGRGPPQRPAPAPAYHSITGLTRLLRGSHLVQHDAPQSVARAFRRDGWKRPLAAAGSAHHELRWRWAFRWQVISSGSPPPAV